MTPSMCDPLDELSVSRETFAALKEFQALVLRWTSAINLVSRSTIPTLWERHILDSAQLFKHSPPNTRRWLDLGSGAGFPGIVIAVLAKELRASMTVTMIESDARKAAFLREAARKLQLDCAVIHGRIETTPPQNADVLSARALCPLDGLLTHAGLHLTADGTALFPKGARREEELWEARNNWDIEVDTVTSISDKHAAILVIRNIRRANFR